MSNIFSRDFNRKSLQVVIWVGVVIGLLLIGSWVYCNKGFSSVVPEQPVSFSHLVHVQQLGMDCRFCHTAVEFSAQAGMPATQTCIACHGEGRILSKSSRLGPIQESWNSGLPIPWVRVHQLPDYVYFNHAAHVSRGMGCVACHGKVGEMDVVQALKPLTMAWCLQCHREPEKIFSSLPVCPFPQANEKGVLSPKSGVTIDTQNYLNSAGWKSGPVSCGGCHR